MRPDNKTEVMLILKYGGIAEAYNAWISSTQAVRDTFTEDELEEIHRYEYYMHSNSGLSHNDPR